jgi:hypothetical protein
VAVPLGLGATVEGQVTGEEVWGGLQLQSFRLNDAELAKWRAWERRRSVSTRSVKSVSAFGAAPPAPGAAMAAAPASAARARSAPAMGLGVGGSMRQEVYADERSRGAWAREPAGRVFVHLVTPPEWRRITGEAPPPSPVDRAAYTRAGLPWFEYYDDAAQDVAPTDTLGSVRPVGEWLGDDHEPWQEPAPHQVKQLGDAPGEPVVDGDW